MSPSRAAAPPAGSERTIRIARVVAAFLAVSPLLLVALAVALPARPASASGSLDGVGMAASLAGFVSLAIGSRVYQRMRARIPDAADATARGQVFVSATALALAVTEAAALLGIFAFLLSRNPIVLTGVPIHVILTGALWPTRPRLEQFLDGRVFPGETG